MEPLVALETVPKPCDRQLVKTLPKDNTTGIEISILDTIGQLKG